MNPSSDEVSTRCIFPSIRVAPEDSASFLRHAVLTRIEVVGVIQLVLASNGEALGFSRFEFSTVLAVVFMPVPFLLREARSGGTLHPASFACIAKEWM